MSRRRGSPRRRRPADDHTRGAVTAEIAVALPALVAIVIGAVWVLAIALAQIRCTDAAREAARAAARGEQSAVVTALATSIAPDDATVRLQVGGDLVSVEVSAQVPVPLPFGTDLPAPAVRGTAAALMEPR
jgi:hypothetical protein